MPSWRGFDRPLGVALDRHDHWSSRDDWYVHGGWTAYAGLTAVRRLADASRRPWADETPAVGSESGVGRAVAASTGRSFRPRACPRKDFRAVFFPRKFFRNSVSFNVPQPDCRRLCAHKKSKCCRMRFRVPRRAASLPLVCRNTVARCLCASTEKGLVRKREVYALMLPWLAAARPHGPKLNRVVRRHDA